MICCPGCSEVYTLERLHWGVSRLERADQNRDVTCTSCSTVFHVTPVYKTTRIGPESPSRLKAWWHSLTKGVSIGSSSR